MKNKEIEPVVLIHLQTKKVLVRYVDYDKFA